MDRSRPQSKYAENQNLVAIFARYATNLESREFWGKVEFIFEGGKLVMSRELTSRKPDELMTYLVSSKD